MKFVEGQKITHKKFGEGLVVKVEQRPAERGRKADPALVYVKFSSPSAVRKEYKLIYVKEKDCNLLQEVLEDEYLFTEESLEQFLVKEC